MDVLAFLVLWLSNWYDGCPCHSVELTSDKINSWQKRAKLRERLGGTCVMGSRRGAEFASGAMLAFVRRILEVSAHVILAELTQLGMRQDELGSIMLEFSRARRHIYFTMVVKHSYWGHEPWCFFAIAHFSEDIARRAAQRCLRLRERLLREPFRPIHWITRVLLFNPKVLEQLRAFASGQSLDDLKELVILAALFRFAYTSDSVFRSLVEHCLGASLLLPTTQSQSQSIHEHSQH